MPLPRCIAGILIYRPRKDERLSWPRWLVIPRWFTRKRSPIQVLTRPDVELSRPTISTTKTSHHLNSDRSPGHCPESAWPLPMFCRFRDTEANGQKCTGGIYPGLELSAGGWPPQFMSTDAHFWVKIGFKFQSLDKISNISAGDPPVLLGQFQHCIASSWTKTFLNYLIWLSITVFVSTKEQSTPSSIAYYRLNQHSLTIFVLAVSFSLKAATHKGELVGN